MKKVNNNAITSNQFMFMLIGTMIAMGILNLPNDVVKNAKESGWISVFIGQLYPLYIVIMAILIYRKFPNNNILFINKKCFGKIMGTLFNIAIGLYFLLYLTAIASGLSNITRTIIITFLSPLKVLSVITFLGAYTAVKGLKILGRVNEMFFYLTIIMCLLPLMVLIKEKSSNVFPVIGTRIFNIISTSKESAYAYGGVEIILLIYPNVSEKNRLEKAAIKSVFITGLIYSWTTFITIYGLGIDIIPSYLVAFPAVVKYIEIPVINNFRFIFMVLWTLVVFKTISNYYYAVCNILNNLIPKISYKKMCIIIYPIVIFLSMKYGNETTRRNFLNFIIPKYTVFIIIYVLLTVLLVHFRKEDRFE